MKKLNLEDSRYCSGLGDVVTWAWVAHGAAETEPLYFYRFRDPDLLSLLNLSVTSDPTDAMIVDAAYTVELNEGGVAPRVDYLRRFLGLSTPIKRPHLSFQSADYEWAETTARDMGNHFALLFPMCAHASRTWPSPYWVDLAWKLQHLGIAAAVVLPHRDERFTNTPRYYFGQSVGQVAALIQKSALVIANDSFAAHLAGTIDKPTLALMGPTKPTVLAHMVSVQCLTTADTSIRCNGCHFKPPFRAACDQGCQSLYRLFPDDVVRKVLKNF